MFSPAKASMFSHFKKAQSTAVAPKTSIGVWAKAQQESCYICNYYKNKDADWKTSKDAIPRGMQKAAGSYPADPPYKSAL